MKDASGAKVDEEEGRKEETVAVLDEEKTGLLYGIEDTISKGIQFMQNAKKHMDLFGEKKWSIYNY